MTRFYLIVEEVAVCASADKDRIDLVAEWIKRTLGDQISVEVRTWSNSSLKMGDLFWRLGRLLFGEISDIASKNGLVVQVETQDEYGDFPEFDEYLDMIVFEGEELPYLYSKILFYCDPIKYRMLRSEWEDNKEGEE